MSPNLQKINAENYKMNNILKKDRLKLYPLCTINQGYYRINIINKIRFKKQKIQRFKIKMKIIYLKPRNLSDKNY